MRWPILLAVVCAGGVADAKPLTGEMRTSQHMNMHTSFGAQGSRSSSRMRLHVTAKTARIDDAGSSREYVMHNNRGTRSEAVTWKLRWSGRSTTRTNNELVLELRLARSTCQVRIEESGRKPVTRPCSTKRLSPAKKLTVVCKRRPAHGKTAALWCHPTPHTSAGTSTPWVIGINSCVLRSGGGGMRGRIRYAPCPKP